LRTARKRIVQDLIKQDKKRKPLAASQASGIGKRFADWFESKGIKRDGMFGGFGFSGPQHYFTLLHATQSTLGGLRGKKLLLISERDFVGQFLQESEGAKVTTFNDKVHTLGQKLGESGFDAVLSNCVFQITAFKYQTNPEQALLEKIGMTQLEKQFLNATEWRVRMRGKVDERGGAEFIEFLKARSNEREQVLRDLAEKVHQGGFVISIGLNSKVLFSTQEATKAGLRIIKINAPQEIVNFFKHGPDKFEKETYFVTILQKK